MDPQQRLFLEVAWEAIEDAGLTRAALRGSRTGVFVASYQDDYAHLQLADRTSIDAYTGTGGSHSITANRLSYLLDLRGPSLTLDTGCSASLVATHLACQSLRNRECDGAIAAGVNLILSPEMTITLSRWGFMAPDGRCKTFDASANGFVRGEGCGVIVLKRLGDALADGDRIAAVIRGSAVNQDGRTTVMTAPSGLAQEAVIREALASAKVAPSRVTYVEAHGTGTSLGDPIEVEALTKVYGPVRPDGSTCALGSVKTNFGHLEAAAGMAGLIKAVLALQRGAIPAHLHFQKLNPHISLDGTCLDIPTALRPWPRGTEPRLAGVSSFGFGGTNAHVVLEEAPALPAPRRAEQSTEGRPAILPLSAHSPEALSALGRAYREMLAGAASDAAAWSLADLGWAAGLRRTHHDHRVAVVGATREEMLARLDAVSRAETPAGSCRGTVSGRRPRLTFVFSGQGSQWWAMAHELLATEAVFRQMVERCDALVRPEAGWSLLDELRADEAASRLDQTEFAQPALFAVQVGLAALWRSWGVRPDAVIGHSVGEIAAAHVSGALGLEDAVRLVVRRGRLMQRVTGAGKMASVELAEADARRAVGARADRVSVAAVNGPTTTVLSGETTTLESIVRSLVDAGVACRMLAVNYAFHSPQVAPLGPELEAALADLTPRGTEVPLISTVTGTALEGHRLDAAYWRRNMLEAVNFAAAIESAADSGCDHFLEVGPHPVLLSGVDRSLERRHIAGTLLPSLRRNQPARATMLASLGQLYCHGWDVAWDAVNRGAGAHVRLPSYPWQRERFWLERATASSAPAVSSLLTRAARHPLLGVRLVSPAIQGALFESQLTASSPALLGDHRIHGTVVFPATGYVEMALAAASVLAEGPHRLEDVVFRSPLVLADDSPVTLHTAVAPEGSNKMVVRVWRVEAGAGDEPESTLLMEATLRSGSNVTDAGPRSAAAPSEVRGRCLETRGMREHYEAAQARGVSFGQSFRCVRAIWSGTREAIGQIETPAEALSVDDSYRLHPGVLDSCLQVVAAAGIDGATYIPLTMESVRVLGQPSAEMWSHARVRPRTGADHSAVVADVHVMDAAGVTIAEVEGLCLRPATAEQITVPRRESVSQWLYEIQWRPAPALTAGPEAARSTEPGIWLILADRGAVGTGLASELDAAGGSSVTISADTAQSDPDSLRRLGADLATSGRRVRGVIHLRSLDGGDP